MASALPRPLLVTGTHRAGKGLVCDALCCTGAYRVIREPLSPRRRPGWVGQPATRWFQSLDDPAGHALRDALPGTLAGQFSFRPALRAMRGPVAAGHVLRDLGRVAWYRLHAHRRTLIDDPFALLSADWFHTALHAEIVVLVRHPASFAASLKLLDYPAPFRDLLAQPSLMAGPMGQWHAEIADFAAREPPVVEQAALLWRVLHAGVDPGQVAAEPHWHLVRFEDVARDPIQQMEALAQSLGTPYNRRGRARLVRYLERARPEGLRREAVRLGKGARLDLAGQVDYFARILTADEINRVRDIAAPVWPRFYTEKDWESA